MTIRSRLMIFLVAAVLAVGSITVSLALPAPKPSQIAATEPTGYLLTEVAGQLAIVAVGDPKPILLLDVWLDSLPERDSRRIAAGIPADSLEEALALAEDYE